MGKIYEQGVTNAEPIKLSRQNQDELKRLAVLEEAYYIYKAAAEAVIQVCIKNKKKEQV